MSLTAALADAILSGQPDAPARERAREGIRDFLAVSWPVLQGTVPDRGLPAMRTLHSAGRVG